MAVVTWHSPTESRADESSIPANVSLESLGYCTPKIFQVRGIFAPICLSLISSSDFREICSTIAPEDRIKCDGSEPNVTAKAADAATLKACAPHVYAGVKAGLHDTMDLAASAVDFAWSWVKQSTQAVYWNINPSGQAKPIGRSGQDSEKTSSRRNGLGGTIARLESLVVPAAEADEAGSNLTVTDGTAAYAAHAAAEDDERVDWFKMILKPEFWIIIGQEIKSALIDGAQGFACLKPELQNEIVCEQIGEWVAGPKIIGLAGKFLKATTAATRGKFGEQVATAVKNSVKMTNLLDKYRLKPDSGKDDNVDKATGMK